MRNPTAFIGAHSAFQRVPRESQPPLAIIARTGLALKAMDSGRVDRLGLTFMSNMAGHRG